MSLWSPHSYPTYPKILRQPIPIQPQSADHTPALRRYMRDLSDPMRQKQNRRSTAACITFIVECFIPSRTTPDGWLLRSSRSLQGMYPVTDGKGPDAPCPSITPASIHPMWTPVTSSYQTPGTPAIGYWRSSRTSSGLDCIKRCCALYLIHQAWLSLPLEGQVSTLSRYPILLHLKHGHTHELFYCA